MRTARRAIFLQSFRRMVLNHANYYISVLQDPNAELTPHEKDQINKVLKELDILHRELRK